MVMAKKSSSANSFTNVSKEQERSELHRAIWQIANDLRGAVDGWEVRLVSGASKRTLKLRLSEKRKKQ